MISVIAVICFVDLKKHTHTFIKFTTETEYPERNNLKKAMKFIPRFFAQKCSLLTFATKIAKLYIFLTKIPN